MTDKKTELINIIKEKSFSNGSEIKLASGRVSNFYFNMKPSMMDSKGSMLIAELVSNRIKNENIDLVGGLEMGAVPLTASLITYQATQENDIQGFFIRKKTKEHGTQKLVEGLVDNYDFKDKRTIIIEDVTTTGGSAIKAAEAIKEMGAEIVAVITVVDRNEGARDNFEKANIEFWPILTSKDFA